VNVIKAILNRWVLAAVLWTGWALINAQSPFDPACLEEAGRIREHLEVFTDRTIYVVNEPVRFRADLRVEGLESNQPWSGVLYVELISDRQLLSEMLHQVDAQLGPGIVPLSAHQDHQPI
jgi:hypothetical protein